MAAAYPNDISHALALLRLHERRREERLPTVGVLVGPLDAALSAWQHWTAEAGYCPSIHQHDEAERLAPSLVEDIRARCDLPRLALNALLQLAGRPVTASTSPLAFPLDGRTLQDLDTLAESVLSEPDPGGTAAVAHEICRITLQGHLASPDLAERLDTRLADRFGRPHWRVLRAMDELIPVGACPAVLLTAPSMNAHDLTDLEGVAGSLAHFAETVPNWPVGMTMSRAEFELYRHAAADSQAKSLVTTGLIVLAEPPRHPFSAETFDASVARFDTRVAAAGATAALAAAPDAARSNAERLLFQMLEGNPITKGQFVPNGCPGFKFGTRQAEVDLLASNLRLAVEIDGYFHFSHPDAYRRDRRKDWLLQSHGYTVVRVLAEDVPTQMEKVLDFLVSVVEHCRRSAS